MVVRMSFIGIYLMCEDYLIFVKIYRHVDAIVVVYVVNLNL